MSKKSEEREAEYWDGTQPARHLEPLNVFLQRMMYQFFIVERLSGVKALLLCTIASRQARELRSGVKHLAEELQIHPATVSKAIGDLMKDEWLFEEIDLNDRRKRNLQLSEKAFGLLKFGVNTAAHSVEQYFGPKVHSTLNNLLEETVHGNEISRTGRTQRKYK